MKVQCISWTGHSITSYRDRISGVYSMSARRALHALRFSLKVFLNRKYKMISLVWFKLLRNEHASSIVQRSAECGVVLFSATTVTSLELCVFCSTGRTAQELTKARHADISLHFHHCPLGVATCHSRDNDVDCHKSVFRWIMAIVSSYCFARELVFFILSFLLQQGSLLEYRYGNKINISDLLLNFLKFRTFKYPRIN
jgi:hypothetical protein